MSGIAAGLSEAGVATTLDDIIGWNAWIEMYYSWWPLQKDNYLKSFKGQSSRCSAFIATGSATKNGEIVFAHSTFDDFWNAQWVNVILDIVPSSGHHLKMQTTPGYIASLTDFFINDAGIFGGETTIEGFNGFNEKGTPEYVRLRQAMQYAGSLDEFVAIINKNVNGGNASVWLIGDRKTGEIGRLEQGLLFQDFQKKTDGYWFGNNTVEDPRIRNLECAYTGYNDIRRHTGGRRTRWPQLLNKYLGTIDVASGKVMIADHYDIYRKKENPCAHSICAHYDNDARYSMSSPYAEHADPYTPAGAVDAKITTSSLAKDMKMLGRWGRPCGTPFMVEDFLKQQPQWNWQKPYLLDRPKREWIEL